MEKNEFPKVLIIGETFHEKSGGGITLSNLFSYWPEDRLAVITSPKNIQKSNPKKCNKYYQLGYLENKPRFPLNLLTKRLESGPIKVLKDSNEDKGRKNSFTSYILKTMKQTASLILQKTGLYFLLSRLEPSKELYKWIDNFNPSIIYTQLSTLELLRFLSCITTKLNIPLAIHIMDDWPISLPNNIVCFKNYWTNIFHNELIRLLNKAEVHLAISTGMAKEYKLRYNLNFKVFHNPIIYDDWKKYAKTSWTKRDPFRIIYTGRLGHANIKSICTISRSVEFISKFGHNITFEIYTGDHDSKTAIMIQNKFKATKVFKLIPHQNIPELLSGSDLLILPLDFDEKSLKFSRLSMPTKSAEYMISGTPIIVFAPEGTHLVRHAQENEWAKVHTTDNFSELGKCILDMIENEYLRMLYGKNAFKFALDNYQKEFVCRNFLECLTI